MPLPRPAGYIPRRQLRVDRRRVVLAGAINVLAALVLLTLAHRVSRTPGELLPAIHPRFWVVVVGMAGFCGVWGETLRQISLTRRGEPGAPLDQRGD
ncbi:hypothetical protein KQ313_08770 [Synechococcus sp. CS-1325]|uniref:hypothetical protein n=1 Tax=unclassified Synechococcus TaxID=2626047 RepID=UPI000DB58245|nr:MULTISPECIES: hypothetical protein [unclassified Synechococcus]MCT0199768.1 hypothetical protein [Synechococcus sp. CS-1325]MCT0214212.1 hypothetical protein [Synechococcus sp. CS-1326]MCT0232542.1 hypothetical protein [Synechococcus sp. CS-1327]PZV01089.1 MAG: hypothetical protein DCF24_05285 [Cyanobium sp.]